MKAKTCEQHQCESGVKKKTKKHNAVFRRAIKKYKHTHTYKNTHRNTHTHAHTHRHTDTHTSFAEAYNKELRNSSPWILNSL